jgi:hypothetical protein
MIDHVWSVLCSRSTRDADSNNISIHNVLEQINIEAEPDPDNLVAIEAEVITLWIRSDANIPSSGRVRLSVITPNGEVAGVHEAELDLLNFERLRSRVRFKSLPASQPGRLIFRLELQNQGAKRWKQVAAIPLTFTFNPPASVEQEETEAELISTE